jgi:dinuclear metal center YbgI/SA1388 family protein
MVLTLKDFLNVLETVASARWAEPWDNPGLQIGSPNQEIHKIFSSLDPTLKALMSASKAGAQLLFTHHPLIFKPLSRLQTDVFPGNIIAEAATRGIAVVAAHTNLDAAPGGINDILAGLLDLTDMEVLKPLDTADGAGLGRIGDLPGPTSLSAVAEAVRKVMGTADIRVVGAPDLLIRRIAVVGGSGGSLVGLAYERSADLLLTGDIGHHVALEAEALGIALIDAGHFCSEKTAFNLFAGNLETLLRSKGWETVVEIDEGEGDPLRICDGG